MGIETRDYNYTVTANDNLYTITDKHGLSPQLDWARKIWDHPKNKQLYQKAKQSGREVFRQIRVGEEQYEKYNHARWEAGYHCFEDPGKIVLCPGEEIYIPSEKNVTKVIRVPYSQLFQKEFELESGHEYRIVVIYEGINYSF